VSEEQPESKITDEAEAAAPQAQGVVADGGAQTEEEQVDPSGNVQKPKSRKPHQPYWWRRPSLQALKRDEEESRRGDMDEWDARGNELTRLPDGESVHVGGLVLAEVFTPSTVSRLYETLRKWPGDNNHRRADWVADLDRCRSGGFRDGRTGDWLCQMVFI
jgi:hypothetical protein